MLDDPDRPNTIATSRMNAGPLRMSNGLTRLETRFLGEPTHVQEVLEETEPFDAQAALDAGLVSFAPDELDWDDEVRLAIEGRAAFSQLLRYMMSVDIVRVRENDDHLVLQSRNTEKGVCPRRDRVETSG